MDRDSQKPVARFTYDYRIFNSTASFDPLLVSPVEVHSNNGSFEILAPKSCAIELHIHNDKIIELTTLRHLTSNNGERKLEILVNYGKTLSGTVVEASSGRPIGGARVAPYIPVNFGWAGDYSRTVSTDPTGKFTISGLDPKHGGIEVRHGNYLKAVFYGLDELEETDGSEVLIELETGERLFGRVTNPVGEPLPDVTVDDGAGKTVKTNNRGEFELHSPEKWDTDNEDNPAYHLDFEKPGFLGTTLNPNSANDNGFSVILSPMPSLSVIVTDTDGRSITNCDISAGVGLEPDPSCCTATTISNTEGRGSIQVDTNLDYSNSRKVWIGVRAPRFAFWETTVEIWEGSKLVQAMLKRGRTVAGTVKGDKYWLMDTSVELLPDKLFNEENSKSQPSQRQLMMRTIKTVDQDGKFTFKDVAAGTYTLTVHGPSISPMSTTISVADSDVVAEEIILHGLGNVKGIAFEPWAADITSRPWAFKEGYIYFADNQGLTNYEVFPHLTPIRFVTDEQGRFHVEGVPTGTVEVRFDPAPLSHIRLWMRNKAKVVENQTAFFDQSTATHDGFPDRKMNKGD
jgi:hypothetical protein